MVEKRLEKGIAAIIVLILGVILLGVLALVIDLTRQQVVIRQLQAAVDAASLAGVNRLDSSIDGWRESKRAFIAALRSQDVRGLGSLYNVSLQYGPQDPLEPDPRYHYSDIQLGNFTVTFRRGAYWESGDGTFEFRNLEDGPDITTRKIQGEVMYFYNGIPSHSIANAVQVQVQSRGIFASFSRIFGYENLKDGQASSVAVVDQNIEECIAPIAIPACALFMDADPRVPVDGQYSFLVQNYRPFDADGNPEDLSSFIPGQCFREIIATEADPYNNNNLSDGRTRFEAYLRAPEYFKPAGQPDACYSDNSARYGTNCRAVPIYAVMGTSEKGPGFDFPASPNDIARVLDRLNYPEDCIRAKIGQRFRPFQFGQSDPIPNMQPVRNKLRQLANAAPASDYLPVVSSGSGEGSDYNDYKNMINFPFPRWTARDRRARLGPYVYDLFHGGSAGQPDRDEYTNPLCTDRKINPNFRNPSRKAIKVKFAVITNANAERPYCHFNDLFSMESQRIQPPDLESKPTIIGFAEGSIFDWNFDPLPESPGVIQNPGNPHDKMLTRLLLSEIRSTDYWRPFVTFVQEVFDLGACERLQLCSEIEEPEQQPGQPAPPPTQCRTGPCPVGHPNEGGDFTSTLDGILNMEQYDRMKQCYNMPDRDIVYNCAVGNDIWACIKLAEFAYWNYDGGGMGCFNFLNIFTGWWPPLPPFLLPFIPPLTPWDPWWNPNSSEVNPNFFSTTRFCFWPMPCGVLAPCTTRPWGYPQQEAQDNNLRCLPKKIPYCQDGSSLDCWHTPVHRQAQRGCYGVRARLDCSQEALRLTSLGPANKSLPIIVQ